MSKRFLLTGLGVVLGGALLLGLFLLGMEWDYFRKGRKLTDAEMSEQMAKLMAKEYGLPTNAPVQAERVDVDRQIRLAIGNLGLPSADEAGRVSDLVLTELKDAKGLESVERQALDKVLNEVNMSASGLVRARDAVRVGKLVRADWFLLGSPLRVNGTNFVVLRIVDARTGVLREAGVFPAGHSATQLATDLAGFVRQCRKHASEAKVPVFLAIGTFEDVSMNNRQADLPTQLRSYLTAAYGKSQFTLLEREFASALFREMQLDLAGLTEEASGGSTPMQSAYWMVDGYYQSYETTQFEVELELTVRRMFGRSRSVSLREKPGEPLFRRVKESIESVIANDQAALFPSRVTEVKAQLTAGRELARIGGVDHLDYIWASYEGYGSVSENEMARRVRNAQEAVRAFETVLLLDPTNREARICLATCFRRILIQRMDEAREYYREIVDSPIEDRWSNVARQALLHSFEWSDPDSRRQWFERAAQGTANAAAAEFYQANAKRAAEDATIRRGGSTKAEELAEVRLFERLKSFNNLVHTGSGSYSADLGMDAFAKALGSDRAMIARRLTDLFPKMKAQFADLSPFLLATIVSFQVDSNAPIIAEFERTLEWSVEHWDKIPQKGTTFWSHIQSISYPWALKHQRNDLAAKILESISRAALVDPAARRSFGDDDDYMSLAFAYIAAERWKDALAVFESFTNRPIEMGASGPWGKAFTVVLPNKQAALCRKQLGLVPVIDPREFDLGEPCLHPHSDNTYYDRLTFLTATDGLWIGLNDHLMQVDFNLQTNLLAPVSPNGSAQVSALCVGTSNVWIGTASDGLFEFDKSTHKTRNFSEKNGLLMDHVSAVHLAGDTLWIGYGNEFSGGLGRLDLSTRRFTSFMSSILNESGANGPPRRRVTEIHSRPSGELWYQVYSTLFRCRPADNIWEAQPNQNGAAISCYVIDDERLIGALKLTQVELTLEPRTNARTNLAAKTTRRMPSEEAVQFQAMLKTNGSGLRVSGTSSGSLPGVGKLEQWSFRDDRRQRLLNGESLPGSATAMALGGKELWIGGQGFVASVDLNENKIKKIAHVPARSVDQIQLGGGYVWVQYDKHIYRAPLQDLR